MKRLLIAAVLLGGLTFGVSQSAEAQISVYVGRPYYRSYGGYGPWGYGRPVYGYNSYYGAPAYGAYGYYGVPSYSYRYNYNYGPSFYGTPGYSYNYRYGWY
jgi:hypothetical protein